MSGRLRLLQMPDCHPTNASSRRHFATQLIRPTLSNRYERALDHLAGFAPLPQNTIDGELFLRITTATTTPPHPRKSGTDRIP
jgi:hypothetical protein